MLVGHFTRSLLGFYLAAGHLACVSTTPQPSPERDFKPGPAFHNDDEFREWFSFYYANPDPARVTAAVEYIVKAGYHKEYPEIVTGFMARLFEREPSAQLPLLLSSAGESQEAVDILLVALWYANTEDSLDTLKSNLAKASTTAQTKLRTLLSNGDADARDMLLIPVTSPRQVNMLWASYSASGDLRYAKRVISLLHYFSESEGPLASIGETAILTLANTALLHEKVAHLCLDDAQNHPDPKTRALLGTMLQVLAQIARESAAEAPAH